jgi:hypothetical protein
MSKLLLALAVLVVSGGCRQCSNSCDYSPTVPGGVPLGPVRSGSNLGASAYTTQPTPMPADQAAAATTNDAVAFMPSVKGDQLPQVIAASAIEEPVANGQPWINGAPAELSQPTALQSP